MSIDSEKDVIGLKRIGRIVTLTVREMAKHLRPGITTAELDSIGGEFLHRYGARSAPRLVYNFPGETCISVNDQVAHGIPGNRIICAGDLVNLDVSAELDGYFADTGQTIAVSPITAGQRKLCECTRSALSQAIEIVQAGVPINLIGRKIESQARKCGFTVIRDLAGHGVGKSIHEEPEMVANYYDPCDHRRLTDGLVITIEPFLSPSARNVTTAKDGWSLQTTDGSVAAQYEHTLIVTRGRPIVVTAV